MNIACTIASPVSIPFDLSMSTELFKAKAATRETSVSGNARDDLKANIEQYYSRINRAISAYTAGSGLSADDLTQETFLKAFARIDDFQQASSVYTWLYRIARNTCIDALRKLKSKKELRFASEFDDSRYETDDQTITLENKEDRQLLENALAKMPESLRMLVVLKDLQDLRYHEIAEIMDINEGTVKSRLFRARLLLKQELLTLGYKP